MISILMAVLISLLIYFIIKEYDDYGEYCFYKEYYKFKNHKEYEQYRRRLLSDPIITKIDIKKEA